MIAHNLQLIAFLWPIDCWQLLSDVPFPLEVCKTSVHPNLTHTYIHGVYMQLYCYILYLYVRTYSVYTQYNSTLI